MPRRQGPVLRVTSVTISTPAPRALASFYAELLAGEIMHSDPPQPGEPDTAGWAQVKTDGPTLNFEFERQWREPVWPAESGQQVVTQHLDIYVSDLASAVAWALQCGARLAEVQPQDNVRVMLDPSGHPFCLFI